MTAFDFFQTEELPVPAVTPEQARDIARRYFGMDVTVTTLGSQQDANFLLTAASGAKPGPPVGVCASSGATVPAVSSATAAVRKITGRMNTSLGMGRLK